MLKFLVPFCSSGMVFGVLNGFRFPLDKGSISDLLVMSLPKEEGSYRKDVDAAGTHDLTGEKLDLKRI